MKNLFLLLLGMISIVVVAQTTPVGAESMTAAERAIRIDDINKELTKLEKKVAKINTTNSEKYTEIEEANEQLDYNGKQQLENVGMTADVKSSMNGYELSALQAKIKRMTSEKHRLENTNKRDANAIIKKKAMIERLYAEIENLENSIATNEVNIADTTMEISETNDIISTNGLVAKDAELMALIKDMNSLKKAEKRLNSKIAKNENVISKKARQNTEYETKITKLNSDKILLKQPTGTKTAPGVH